MNYTDWVAVCVIFNNFNTKLIALMLDLSVAADVDNNTPGEHTKRKTSNFLHYNSRSILRTCCGP